MSKSVHITEVLVLSTFTKVKGGDLRAPCNDVRPLCEEGFMSEGHTDIVTLIIR